MSCTFCSAVVMNKKLIILIVLVLGVWGAIGYRVYVALNVDEVPVVMRKRKVTTDTIAPTRYTLLLSYPDPFLKKAHEVKQKVTPRPSTINKKQTIETPLQSAADTYIDWNKVEYLGAMRNARTGVWIATIKIAEKEYLVREQEQVDLFSVTYIRADSIGVKYNKNRVKNIKRKN